MPEFESRGTDLWPDGDFDIRATGDGLTLEGYAALYGVRSVPLPGPSGTYTETIRAGAFTKTLEGAPDVTLRYQHNLTTLPLARTKSGTLEIAEDERGLRVRASLPDNEFGRPIRDAIARRDISGMSFSFRAIRDEWSKDRAERALVELRLGPEVSVVDFPAYPDTSVFVRSLAEAAGAEPDAIAEAVAVLRDPEGRLTPDQRDLLLRAVNARTDDVLVSARAARMRERLAALA